MIKQEQIPNLLFPTYLRPQDARPLVAEGMITYDHDSEEYRRTEVGRAAVDELRQVHGMRWDKDAPGGGRWRVGERHLHCGDVLQVMLGSGHWQSVRFEVEFTNDNLACLTGGRVPRLYLALAGGDNLVCSFNIETALFRWRE
jgi:hypothetical protein